MSNGATDSPFLHNLNAAQLNAVQHSPDVPLQILAGPGSGKTRVLTSRIAHLILHPSSLLPPQNICAVTFTNKAANELKERLERLIGNELAVRVKMGTFHSLCAGFLRRYGAKVGLEGNFTICDADESKKIITKLLEPIKPSLESASIFLKEGMILSLISKAKAKGHSADDLLSFTGASTKPLLYIDRTVAAIYKSYEGALRRANALDFDDLLVFGLKLFREWPDSVGWCKYVLVDEFQDTNTIQYLLMKHLAASHGRVTVVGDPDQSIYGWRSAEIENLAKMGKDFPGTQQIFLVENYRSTGSILASSLAIVAQDKSRIPKTLHTLHPSGSTPFLHTFSDEAAEAAFIAMEVTRVVAASGGMLNWNDFVVLLRFNALSRAIESALQKEGIASRVLGGHKFFERAEIKDLLAYLHIVDNPHFMPAFSRAINTPNRGIGDKTLGEILARATKLDISPVSVVEKIWDGKIPDVKPPVRKKLDNFVEPLRILKKRAMDGETPAGLIHLLLDLVKYEEYLKDKDKEWETRWENVQELVNFATEAHEGANSMEQEHTEPDVELTETPLRLFLQASMLSSEGDNDDGSKEKVTISTCHAAKGLEWPVVMVPAVEQGTFPFYRTDDVEEERRLLYVACTRAQGLLYLSQATKRRVGGETRKKDLSEFVSLVIKQNETLFTTRLPDLRSDGLQALAKVLDRQMPPQSEIDVRLAEFNKTHRAHGHDDNGENSYAVASRLWNGSAKFYTPVLQTCDMKPVSVSSSLAMAPAQPLVPTRTIVTNSSNKPTNSIFGKLPLSQTRSSPSTLIQPLNPLPPSTHRAHATNISPFQTSPTLLSVHPHILTPDQPRALTGVKRRLGMGRIGTGYTNKKFKTPEM